MKKVLDNMDIVLDEPGICIEKLCECAYVVRGLPDNKRHPGYWNWVCTATVDATGKATLSAFALTSGGITPSQFRHLKNFFGLKDFAEFKRIRLKYQPAEERT